ncbi:MAG: glycosylase [Planctomycetota bacterium]
MLPRLDTTHLVRPADIPPSRDDFEVIGAFNPGACPAPTPQHPQRVALLIRVAERPLETRANFHASPRYTQDGTQAIDWIDDALVDAADPRKVVFHDGGFKRLTFTSHLRVAFTYDGNQLDELGPIVSPVHPTHGLDPLATFGYEDPRLTPMQIDGRDTFIITAVGASEHGVVTRVLRTDDFESFDFVGDPCGCGFCRENKDVTLFPGRVGPNQNYAAIHRPTGQFSVSPPSMWLADSPDLIHFGNHRPLYAATFNERFALPDRWDNRRIGGGAPPVLTEAGWLVLYHGATPAEPGKPAGTYAGGAMLLDPDDPSRILSVLPQPFMSPTEDFETAGFVNAVVFPTGVCIDDERLEVYYGAADTHVGRASFQLSAMLDALHMHRRQPC